MSQSQTSVADRHHMIDLKLQGYTLRAIADRSGWSVACVRKWWRRYRDHGRAALDAPDGRKQRGGRMSTFAGVIRFACLRLKKMHPGWGAAVVRPRLAQRLGLPLSELPCVSTIEKYWASFGSRLISPQRPRRPTVTPVRGARATQAHERWQADFQEQVVVAGCGLIDVFNIRDEATPVKVASVVYRAHTCDGVAVQAALRDAFSQWGLCDRLQTDRDKRFVSSTHDHPFPTRLVLWLAGLGIHHDIAPSAQANGCAERFHRTWHARVVEGRTVADLADLQRVSDEELDWMNHKLPSRGRNCDGQPPLLAYPEAAQPRRPYTRQTERESFELPRVYEYLSAQWWWRRVTTVGQISLGGQRYGIGAAYGEQDVKLTFDPAHARFIVENAQGQLIKQLAPKQLSVAAITGLEPPSA